LLVFTGVWPAFAKLNVVATTPDLGAIAQAIGGERIELTVLAKPTEDPHFVAPKPSFIVKLNRADVLIEGGAELESGWLPPLLEGARNPKLTRLGIAPGIRLLEVATALDRSKGDVHALGNPHFMMDPLNGQVAAQRIADAFAQRDAAGVETYRANVAQFNAQLDAKWTAWRKLLAPLAGKRIVAYHNTWPYFAERFGLKIDLFLEPRPGIPPTPASLTEVIAAMKAEHVRVVILEPYQNRKTANTVAEATSAVVVPVTQYPGGVKGTEGGYIEMIDFLVTALAKGLAP
jgi:zinc/manganese transport system substrate-binding protein